MTFAFVRAAPWCAAICVCVAAPTLRADEMKVELDCVKNPKRLESHFKEYGQEAVRTITREPGAVRIWLSNKTKEPKQTGLFSYFALAGDFEIAVNYELLSLAVPKTGYGVSCGIAVDSDEKTVQLVRGQQVGNEPGYVVTEQHRTAPDAKFEDLKRQPSKSKVGQLVLKREKATLICLVADTAKGPLDELHRVPFPTGTVRKVRLYADAGGSPNTVDIRISQVRVRAEEISTDVPIREQGGTLVWWLAGLGIVAAASLGYFLLRRYRNRSDD